MTKFRLFLVESRAAVNQALGILRRKNIENPEETLKKIEETLGKNNRKYFPLAAFFYDESRFNFPHIMRDFISIAQQLSVNVTKKHVTITHNRREYQFDQSDESWQRFEHFVHGIQAEKIDKEKLKEARKNKRDAGQLIKKKNNIEIRLARDTWDAIALGQGTSFCISAPGTPHFATYRLQQRLTTYFIFDDNFPPDHPLHLVVYMVPEREGDVLLTDLKNTTGTIQNPYSHHEDRGKYVKEYQQYLKEHGIDVFELLTAVPLTEKEEEIIRKFKNKIRDLEEFKRLSAEDKLNYLMMWYELTDEQVCYLIDWVLKHPYDYKHIKVLHHYFYAAPTIPMDCVKKLDGIKFEKTNLLKHYLDYRVKYHNRYAESSYGLLRPEEYELLSEKEKKKIKLDVNLIMYIIGDKFDINKFKELVKDKKIPDPDCKMLSFVQDEPVAIQLQVLQHIEHKPLRPTCLTNVKHPEIVKYLLKQESHKLEMTKEVAAHLKRIFSGGELIKLVLKHFDVMYAIMGRQLNSLSYFIKGLKDSDEDEIVQLAKEHLDFWEVDNHPVVNLALFVTLVPGHRSLIIKAMDELLNEIRKYRPLEPKKENIFTIWKAFVSDDVPGSYLEKLVEIDSHNATITVYYLIKWHEEFKYLGKLANKITPGFVEAIYDKFDQKISSNTLILFFIRVMQQGASVRIKEFIVNKLLENDGLKKLVSMYKFGFAYNSAFDSLFDVLAMPKYQKQLYHASRMLLENVISAYVYLIYYLINNNHYDAISRIFPPWKSDKINHNRLLLELIRDTEFIDWGNEHWHLWALKTVANKEYPQDFNQMSNLKWILSHVDKLKVNPNQVSQYIIEGINNGSINIDRLAPLAGSQNKYQFFHDIQNAGILNQDEIYRLKQIMEIE